MQPRCTSCNCWRETTTDELTTDEWRAVLDQLRAMRMVKVNLTGGEPLVRRDCIELMAHATRIGIPHLHLNTNGLLLDDTRRAAVLSAGVRSFNVSVDGSSAGMHDLIRGRRGAFDRTIAHLEALVAERDRFGLQVRMNFTVMRTNVADLPGIAALAQRLAVPLYLNLATDTTFLFRAPGVGDLAQVEEGALRSALAELEEMLRRDRRFLPRPADLRYLRRHFTERIQREVPCAESQLKLMIHSRGEIGGCWAEDPTMNVRQRSISSVVDSPEYREEHARLFRKDCVGCGSNYSLNLRWRPSSYRVDAAWRRGQLQLHTERPRHSVSPAGTT
ncbi:MAG: radical SAM protein [Acidimicrobiales bacterium]